MGSVDTEGRPHAQRVGSARPVGGQHGVWSPNGGAGRMTEGLRGVLRDEGGGRKVESDGEARSPLRRSESEARPNAAFQGCVRGRQRREEIAVIAWLRGEDVEDRHGGMVSQVEPAGAGAAELLGPQGEGEDASLYVQRGRRGGRHGAEDKISCVMSKFTLNKFFISNHGKKIPLSPG